MIYFDNAATTKIYNQSLEAFQTVATTYWGNPSSLHQLGTQAKKILQQSRKQIATLLDVPEDWIIFTSGGTEGNNWAIKGTAFEKQPFGSHIVTTKIEHPAVIQTFKQLEKLGFKTTYLSVNQQGELDFDEIHRTLTKETTLLSVMAVNNEVGFKLPIEKLCESLKDYPWIHFHVDAVQAIEDARTLLSYGRVDFLTLSAHKFHGPRGVGILVKKPNRQLMPLLCGGGQEFDQRSTTENLPGIVATAKSLRLCLEKEDQRTSLFEKTYTYLSLLDDVHIFSSPKGTNHILCFALKGVRGEVLVHALEESQIYLSTTSACSSKKSSSHKGTLHAIQIDEELAKCAVRLSFSKYNTMEEVEQFISVFELLRKKFAFLTQRK